MTLRKTILFVLALFLSAHIATAQKNEYNVIPAPQSLKAAKGTFTINENTRLYFEKGVVSDIEKSFFLLSKRLNTAAGIQLQQTSLLASENIIICKQNNSLEKDEAYKLRISPKKIEIEAKTAIGFFYATQTLRQLLPTTIESKQLVANVKWTVPSCTIEDAPMFSYRGLHLDVCRNFVSKEEIKEYIDQLALLKLNIFHWHLTDDQGWRIEIKAYPKLIEVGAYRNRTMLGHHNDYPRLWSNERTGGYYTQEEIKEVVAYATERFVTIIPEIEMPGHATAAIASYPEYSCSGGPFDVEGRWGVFNDVFCSKDETFTFLENILAEVAALFPAPYIHIGGDESPKVRWERCHACQEKIKEEGLKDEHELQSYFIKRIEKIVQKTGKRIIGWDEILDGGIAPDATVMSWRGVAGGISAARQGHDVIMTPSEAMYFDFYQSQLNTEPPGIGGYVPIEKVYAFNPMPSELAPEELKHILGLQANVWTEYMPTREHREYMIFPRTAALAEVAWLPQAKKSFAAFAKKLPAMMERYDHMGMNYSKAYYSIIGTTVPDKETGLKLELSSIATDVNIHYTTDGSEPTIQSPVYSKPIPVSKEKKTVRAISLKDGKVVHLPYQQDFIVNKAAGQRIIFEEASGNKFEQSGGGNFTDCMYGKFPLGRFDWFSYAGGDGSITIVFNKPTSISKISFSSANQNNVFVYSPKKIEYLISEDGVNFKSVGALEHAAMAAADGKATIEIAPITVQKVKMNIHMYGDVPADKAGTGSPTALFMDEIVVE